MEAVGFFFFFWQKAVPENKLRQQLAGLECLLLRSDWFTDRGYLARRFNSTTGLHMGVHQRRDKELNWSLKQEYDSCEKSRWLLTVSLELGVNGGSLWAAGGYLRVGGVGRCKQEELEVSTDDS